jgi:hypothetical protein
MGWLRLDDAFGDHPKIAGLSDRAFRAHVLGLLYCARQVTDGFVPKALAPRARVLNELTGASLWTATRGGYRIHDWLDWNPSRAEVDSKRAAKSMAGAKGAASRWQADAKASASRSHDRGNAPIPSPTPTPPQQQELKTSGEAGFAVFYERFPRHMKPRDAETAYNAALRRASHAEIMAGVDRLVADPNLPPKDLIPYPATWLRADSWKNDPYEPESNGKGPPRDRAAEILRGAAAKGGSRGSLPG